MATWRWIGDVEIGGQIIFNVLGGQIIVTGDGDPEGVVSAVKGSLYLRADGGAGTTLYVKESGNGNTGWIGK